MRCTVTVSRAPTTSRPTRWRGTTRRSATTGSPASRSTKATHSCARARPDRHDVRKGALPRVHRRDFTTLKPRPAEDEHLGFLGPVIRAEVGDTIKIVFRNNARFPASMHPHGVLYDKDTEGAPYADGTGRRKGDDAVAAGGTHTYTWQVPERAGPGPSDGSSVIWMYHSHTDEVADTYAGLIGPMIITARGQGESDGSPRRRPRVVQHVRGREREPEPVPRRRTSSALRRRPGQRRPGRRGLRRVATSCTRSTATSTAKLPTCDDERRARALVSDRHGHRGRSPHAALARQHRRRSAGMRTDIVEATAGQMSSRTWCRTTPARGCSTATSTTTSPPECSTRYQVLQ